MKKILFLTLLCLCYSLENYAQHNFRIQNNTPFHFEISVDQSSTYMPAENSWAVATTESHAWEINKEVVTFSEEERVPAGETITWTATAKYEEESVNFSMQARGMPEQNVFAHAIGTSDWTVDEDFHQEKTTLGGMDISLKYQGTTSPEGVHDVLFVIHMDKPYSLEKEDFENPNVLTVMSYNIQLLPAVTPKINGRAGNVAYSFSPYQDVVIFQELFEDEAREEYLIPAMLEVGFTHYSTVLNPPDDILPGYVNGGVQVFSRWPILEQADFDYTECDHGAGDCLSNKGVKYTSIDKLGKTYHLFGSHLEAGGSDKEDTIRMLQYREIREFVKAQNIPAEEPVIIGGDFNTGFESIWYMSMLDSLPLIEPVRYGVPISTTERTSYFGPLGRVIDYVFCLGGYQEPISFSNTFLVLRGIEDDVWGVFDFGDHYPVNSRIEYTDAIIDGLEEENTLKSKVNVYFDPIHQQLQLNTDPSLIGASISLVDINGQLIYQDQLQEAYNTIDLVGKSRGVVMVLVDGVCVDKIVLFE